MSSVKKLPMEPASISSGDSRIVGLSRFTPPEASLFLAIGTVLLETLNRMKLQPNYSTPMWTALENKKEEAANIARERGCESQFIVCNQMFDVVKNSDIVLASQWIKSYLEQNLYDACAGLDLGMRCYLSAIVNKSHITRENFTATVNRSSVLILQNLVGCLRVHILLSSNTGLSYIKNSSQTDYPLLCIHEALDKTFSVAYLEDFLHVDQTGENPPRGIARFPFIYGSQTISTFVMGPGQLPPLKQPSIPAAPPGPQPVAPPGPQYVLPGPQPFGPPGPQPVIPSGTHGIAPPGPQPIGYPAPQPVMPPGSQFVAPPGPQPIGHPGMQPVAPPGPFPIQRASEPTPHDGLPRTSMNPFARSGTGSSLQHGDPKVATDPVVIDLVNAMSRYIITGGEYIDELEASIDKAKQAIPGLYTSMLEDLRNRL